MKSAITRRTAHRFVKWRKILDSENYEVSHICVFYLGFWAFSSHFCRGST